MLERARYLSRYGHTVLVIAPHRNPLPQEREEPSFRIPSRIHVLRIKPMAWRLLPSVNAADYHFLQLRLFQP
ncbi:MAG: hypothetical protein ACRETC_01730, partial [Gammaproteobacteria bacterium]